MSDDGQPAFERLTPRQRACLRLVYDRHISKQIAKKLGISAGTVDTYITDAIATLRAENRRHAAELLHEFERLDATPRKLELDSSGVADAADFLPKRDPGPQISISQDLLPFRSKGAFGNDLKASQRIFWTAQVGVALAIGFGMLVVGLEVFSRLFGNG
jgi:DNA-binding CsgD family transcriptional regulator